ncbi:MAG TPA: hypothetical protein VG053_05565 [Solirubrobacteraceae bacterium]|jgi:hypothetical protein|nr:hypothetical protein [Solirubrobacteraceae bacterium]
MELDKDALNQWFQEKWKHGACPVCEVDRWALLPRLGMVPNANPPGPTGGNMVPVLLIVCSNCGYLLSINALTAGVVETADWNDELAKYSESERVPESSR